MTRGRFLASVLLCCTVLVLRLEAQGPPRRTLHESECGREIPWVESFEEATRKASESRKPIFWFVPSAWQSRMDRKQELYWYMMGGAFTDPALVTWISENFVPLKLGLGGGRRGGRSALPWIDAPADQAKTLAAKYGIEHLKFIEPGFVLLDSGAELVHVFDRLGSYNSEWMRGMLAQVTAKNGDRLGMIGVPVARDLGGLAPAYRALAGGDVPTAAKLFSAAADDAAGPADSRAEATFMTGVCHHLRQETTAGDATWKKLAESAGGGRWRAKARLELERWGPFIHGFEDWSNYPAPVLARGDLRTSRVPVPPDETGTAVDRALNRLLALQREDGSFDDSRYDFGGVDSLPNVWVAVTAIAGRALLAWHDRSPQRIDQAVDRALPYLLDEKNTNPEDEDELIWAHGYRLLFFAALAEKRPELAVRARAKMQEIVALIEKQQMEGGAWHHEYPNPFASAHVLYALSVAQKAGAKVKKAAVDSGAQALASTRSDAGIFAYGQSAPRGTKVESSAGRMSLCELALFLAGKSDAQRLTQAIDTSFTHHERLEAVRRYDDHSDSFGNGGFFFWYDMEGRALAVEACPSPRKGAWKAQLRDQVLGIHEVDGGWLDSHELGKSYGTAMGLIVLSEVSDLSQ